MASHYQDQILVDSLGMLLRNSSVGGWDLLHFFRFAVDTLKKALQTMNHGLLEKRHAILTSGEFI